MLKTSLFKQTFLLLCVIGVSDFVANKLYLYWTVWWFDMYMHFISGVCVGMAGVLVWQYLFDKNISFKKSLFVSMFAILVIGVAWEVFESYFDIAMVVEGGNYFLDTTSDIILDFSGAILGSIYAHRIVGK
ncbi:MAG: putative membrane protein (4 TMH) [Parcubacteria bacterium C7867-003]|nr:MAG: putative membrane protein (4 TMH) [Parcubacteria bacterium C7867-003]